MIYANKTFIFEQKLIHRVKKVLSSVWHNDILE